MAKWCRLSNPEKKIEVDDVIMLNDLETKIKELNIDMAIPQDESMDHGG